ncbi:glycosyltransferase [Neobacillus bataviensis]|uniref:glycosyltransferase n=1 Tax=Neobacillus bataviensis TaxID=220685 RepID=UPI001CBB1A0E|nr:glycosyltransferase [Neobacillus bataviensis]
MKYIYIGALPPPYGGVTIKNNLLFNMLSKHIDIEQCVFFDKRKNLFWRIIKLLTTLLGNSHGLIIGISRNSLKMLTYILFFTNKKIMNKSIVMVMGGTFPQMVATDVRLGRYVKEYKCIYVETNGMKKVLNSVGVNNVSIFPNCREKPNKNNKILESNQPIRCLSFSLISIDKGIDLIIDAAILLEQMGIDHSIDFYGHIDPEFEKQFKSSIALIDNLDYLGVFKSDNNEDVYEKLQQYDVLLFPTKCDTEGVPGVLVESKFAGIPAIVSDLSFNSEIIKDGETGIVLNHNIPDELADSIKRLDLDRKLLLEMKHNARASAEQYLIDNYLESILRVIRSK